MSDKFDDDDVEFDGVATLVCDAQCGPVDFCLSEAKRIALAIALVQSTLERGSPFAYADDGVVILSTYANLHPDHAEVVAMDILRAVGKARGGRR